MYICICARIIIMFTLYTYVYALAYIQSMHYACMCVYMPACVHVFLVFHCKEGLKIQSRACFKENSSRNISIAKAGLQFLNDLFYQKISIYPAKFSNDFFVTAQTAFHHCIFRFITAHFVHHCTLKQALLFGENRGGNSRF